MVIQSRKNIEWKKKELAKYMPRALAYRCLAQSPVGDTHLIVTSDRARAVKFYSLFLGLPGWSEARIELGTRTYTTPTLERLP